MRFGVKTAESVLEDLRSNSRSVLDIFEDRVSCTYIYQSVQRELKTSPSVLYKHPQNFVGVLVLFTSSSEELAHSHFIWSNTPDK